MKKSEYLKYIDPKAFKSLYEEWASKGKPTGNDPLYIKIWDGATNASKACIGALQEKFRCSYQNYDEKVLQTTMLVVRHLLKHEEPPNNIVNVSWLPALGVCCGNKAKQEDFEDSMLSINLPVDEGEAEYEELLRGEYGIQV